MPKVTTLRATIALVTVFAQPAHAGVLNVCLERFNQLGIVETIRNNFSKGSTFSDLNSLQFLNLPSTRRRQMLEKLINGKNIAFETDAQRIAHAKKIGESPFFELKSLTDHCYDAVDCWIHALTVTIQGGGSPAPGLFKQSFTQFMEQRLRPTSTPRDGDWVVYSVGIDKRVVHLGIYRGINSKTGKVQVESKLGSIPGIFLHDVENVPTSYGGRVEYFSVFDQGSNTP